MPPGGGSGKLQGTHPPVLHAHGQHDDHVHLLLPHQPPEVLQRLFERPLGGNDLLWVAVALRCGVQGRGMLPDRVSASQAQQTFSNG